MSIPKKQRTCRVCRSVFQPIRCLQNVCSPACAQKAAEMSDWQKDRIPETKCEMPGCRKVTEVFGSRWCSECYYPGIDRDFQRYKDLREEGYSTYQAKVMAGLADPDEAKE